MIAVQKLLLKTLAFSLIALSLNPTFSLAQPRAGKPALYPMDNLPELRSNQGFALFYVDSEIDSASIEIRPLSTKTIGPQSRDSKVWKYKGKEVDISLKGLEPGFYAMPVEKGVYQILKIRAPYFDLPYWLDTTKDVRYQFNVFSNQLNYVGHLVVDKERGNTYINVGLHNRIAMDIDAIQQTINTATIELPLRMGTGVKDDFLTRFNGEQK